MARFCIAQSPGYLFQRLGVKDGLFEETVHGVQQDAKGFIWINFRTLIQRYDGYRLISFFPGNQLPEGNVRGLQVDKKNRLWLLSGDATLGYLDPDNFSYHPVKVNIPAGFNHTVTGMYVNRQDQVMLIWDKQGMVTYTGESGVADMKNNPFTLPRGWEPVHVWQAPDNNYWIGSINGLVKYNTARKSLSYRGHNDDHDPAISAYGEMKMINLVYVDSADNCWVVTWEGGLTIQSFSRRSGERTEWSGIISKASGNGYYVPFGITETAGNELWLTGSGILCRINTERKTVDFIPRQSPGEYSIYYDIIFLLYEDREKNIWVGTNKGLFRFNPQGQFFTIMPLKRPGNVGVVDGEVTDLLETADGELLVSTWGNGIFTYNKNLQAAAPVNVFGKNALEGTMVWSMLQRPNGDIWCGMQNGALYIFEAATRKFIHELPPAAEGKTIRQLIADHDGNIWLGTHGGAIIKWDTKTRQYTKVFTSAGVISNIYADNQNRIWAGTDRDGLYVLDVKDGKVLQHYTSNGPKGKKLLINGVADLLQYNDSIFYIAGNGLSILNVNTGNFKYYTIDRGLPSANISNLVKDDNGYIWMTCGSGILSYHPVKSKLSHFNAADGVHNYNFTYGAGRRLKNGNIAFGTNKDFLVFNPGELSKRVYAPPRVQIAGIEIMGENKNVDSVVKLPVIRLKYNQNAFKFFFTTLLYKDVVNVYYQLEGIDKSWKQAGKQNIVEYNYLPPGHYTLNAACFSEDGKTPGEITRIKFFIRAPFYQQWWFIGLVAMIAGGVLFWLDRERIKRRDSLHKMRADIAGNLHRDVNTALQNINILSEMARLKADKDIEKSKEFIEQIHGKSNTMMIALDDMLWSIDPANDSMEKTILRMQEFIESLSNRNNVVVSMLVDDKVKKLNLNMQLRHDAFIFLRDSIRMIVSTGVKSCRVHISFERNIIFFTVQYDNDCCDLQQLSNYLHSTDMQNRMKAINASLETDIRKNTSVLSVKVPVKE